MRRHAEVVVVGGGIVGVATLRALARAGVDTVLVEQHELGHSHGSSHGTSRIFRLAYPNAAYSRLALEALTGWRELETESGEPLIVHTGTLDLGDAAADVEDALDELDIPFELVTPAAAAERWQLECEPGAHIVFQPGGGYSLADHAHAAFVAGALAAGGEVLEQTRVEAVETDANGVRVETTGGRITAAAVVVAAGGWARGLLAPLGIDLPVTVTRETVGYYAYPDVEDVPPVIEYPSAASPLPDGQAYYALPAPGRGLKAGVHHSGPHADPDEEGVPDPAVLEATSAWVSRRFTRADPTPHAAETCLYTNTADESFLIEAHGRVVVASACSGHGFKFAPVHGARIAALARRAES